MHGITMQENVCCSGRGGAGAGGEAGREGGYMYEEGKSGLRLIDAEKKWNADAY